MDHATVVENLNQECPDSGLLLGLFWGHGKPVSIIPLFTASTPDDTGNKHPLLSPVKMLCRKEVGYSYHESMKSS
ncbi:hypothetical protein NPIL_45611 [Nephila pilipes]|uniref:Uncharacterized protein n=1 Tax=Nephila pilipes TaxID=299642 RepID=A0A8X6QLQ2_NEPPI|nr:hypothetical protein NPIL_45611 [Nephila pilipes]